MANMQRLSLQLLVALAAAQACYAQSLHTLQTLHAQQSYHICPTVGGPVRALFTSPLAGPSLATFGSPAVLDYTMPALGTLLGTRAVRSLEFNLVYDPVGNSYRDRAGPALSRSLDATTSTSEIRAPTDFNSPAGWKVANILHLDYLSTCYSLRSCLTLVKNWSAANANHLPIFIRLRAQHYNFTEYFDPATLLLLNSALLSGVVAGKYTGPWSLVSTPAPAAAHLTAMEAEIRSVFTTASQIFTPNNFRGTYATQRARIQGAGWPPLTNMLNKVVFILSSPSPYIPIYRSMFPGTSNALMFIEEYPTPAVKSDPSTVFVQMEGVETGGGRLLPTAPLADRIAAYRAECTSLVTGGFMVRGIADTNTTQARVNDPSSATASLQCGAHFIDTAYPNGHTSACATFTSTYTVRLRSGTTAFASVCNPITRTSTCAVTSPPTSCTCHKTL